MRNYSLLFSVAALALVSPAMAETIASGSEQEAATDQAKTATPAPKKAAEEEVFSTGVAKGRDRLDSATSTSALKASEIEKLGPRSIADILSDIPGMRAEASTGEGLAKISIRGLPIAAAGAKF